LFYSKAADGKTLAQIFLEMKNNGTAHLANLIKQLAKGKLGMFPVQKTLVYAGTVWLILILGNPGVKLLRSKLVPLNEKNLLI